MAAKDSATNYALGSVSHNISVFESYHDEWQVLNHVLLHQTIIGEEALKQFAKVDDYPDIIVGCTGGGSNFAGLAFPFIRENLTNGKKTVVRGAEPASCPSLTRGEYRYDFGDSAGMTPLMKMHTLGHDFVPDPIHAGGLRYHGMVESPPPTAQRRPAMHVTSAQAPLLSHVYELGLMDAVAVSQLDCFAAGVLFARTEGIVPAPEPTHALAEIIRIVNECKATGESKVLLTALCGHGHFDLAAYVRVHRSYTLLLPALLTILRVYSMCISTGMTHILEAKWSTMRFPAIRSRPPCPPCQLLRPSSERMGQLRMNKSSLRQRSFRFYLQLDRTPAEAGSS